MISHNTNDRRGPTMPLAVSLLALLVLSPAYAAIYSGPDLSTTLLYYQPVPATPGSLLDVTIQLQNNGETARNVKVIFVDNQPFSLGNEVDRSKSFETIPGSQSALIKYQVRVGQDALPGTNYLKLQYTLGGGSVEQTVLLPLDVDANEATLSLTDVQLDPDVFIPGGVGRVRLTVRNDAGLRVSSGNIRLDLSGIELVPIEGTNQQVFRDLNAGQEQTFSFDLAPSPSITPGIYKLPVNWNYTDLQGTRYQGNEYIGIRIGSKPDLTISVDSSEVTKESRTGDVILRVTNKGLGEVKFVDIVVGESASFELTSESNQFYVGNIDSDDYKTAQLSLTAAGDTVEIPVTMTYMDALNTPYKTTQTLTMRVRSGNGDGSVTPYLLVGLVIVAGIAIFLWRRRKRR